MAGMGRYVARLYAQRRKALDRYVPFWLPGEGSGQGGRQGGQGTCPANPLKTDAGQGGQAGQGAKIVTGENAGAHVHAPPWEGPSQEGVPSRGPQFHPDHPDHPDQASNGAGFYRSGQAALDLTVLTAPRICEHCKHFRRDDGWSRSHRCRRGGFCLSQRQGGDCGPGGLLWEPRS